MSLKLRPILPDDLQAATHAGLAAWVSTIAASIDHFDPAELSRIERAFRDFLLSHLSNLASTQECLIIGDLGGQVVGFYNLDCSICDLTDLWIAPQWHGQGMGSAFMHHAKETGLAAGHHRMTLEVLAGNDRAVAFYAKEGFEVIGRKVQYDPVLERRIEKLMMGPFFPPFGIKTASTSK